MNADKRRIAKRRCLNKIKVRKERNRLTKMGVEIGKTRCLFLKNCTFYPVGNKEINLFGDIEPNRTDQSDLQELASQLIYLDPFDEWADTIEEKN